jgi:hypothetical protein
VDLPVLRVYRERIKKNAAVSTDAQIAFSKKAEQITTVPHDMQAVPGREAHAAPGNDYPDFTENAQGGLIKGFLSINLASKPVQTSYRRKLVSSDVQSMPLWPGWIPVCWIQSQARNDEIHIF